MVRTSRRLAYPNLVLSTRLARLRLYRSSMSVEALLISAAGILILYTSTVVGFAMWLNNRFNSLLSTEYYDDKHTDLERRVREIELWRASVSASEQVYRLQHPK